MEKEIEVENKETKIKVLKNYCWYDEIRMDIRRNHAVEEVEDRLTQDRLEEAVLTKRDKNKTKTKQKTTIEDQMIGKLKYLLTEKLF